MYVCMKRTYIYINYVLNRPCEPLDVARFICCRWLPHDTSQTLIMKHVNF